MKELTEHKAYELLKTEYEETAIDYVIMATDADYEGPATHKQAVIEAFQIINKRISAGNRYGFEIELEPEKMKAGLISMEEFLQLPDDEYYDTRPKVNRAFSIPEPLPYWFAFLDPPYGVPYLKRDFISFNNVLFPDKEHCEVYRWNDGFSNYFDEGKEWWGTGIWTVFDRKAGVMVVIGASLTD